MPFKEGASGAEIAKNLFVGHHSKRWRLGCRARAFNTAPHDNLDQPLEALKTRAYRAGKFRVRIRAPGSMHCQGYR